MPYIPYEELESPGDDSGRGFVKGAANAVRGAVCTMYKNYQDWFHQGVGESYRVPPGELINQFWNDLCDEPPYEPPPPPAPPFNGGQCPGVYYRIDLSIFYDGQFIERATRWTRGPISFIGVDYPLEGAFNVVVVGKKANGSEDRQVFAGGSADYKPSVSNVVVTPDDGSADTCGNPPAPPAPPIAQPPPKIETNVNFDFGGNQFDMPITISPQIHVGGRYGFNPDVDLNFTVDASADFNFEGPQFNFDPQFNLNPQLNFNFASGGVNVNIGGNTYNNTLAPSLNPSLEPSEGDEVEEGEEEKDAKGLKFVKVTLTKLPDKVQYGNGSRNVYFAGWIEFLVGDSALPRTQINFEESLFEAPEYSDGYSVAFTNGAKGRVTKYTLKG